jgi:hypothetical protein
LIGQKKYSLFPAGTYVESCVVKPLTLVRSNKSAPVNPPVSAGIAAIDSKCVHLLTDASPLSLPLSAFPWLLCAMARCVDHVTLTRHAGET